MLAPLFRLQNDMNRLFETFFEDLPTTRPFGAAYPAMNLWEDGNTAYIECELPGMTLEDVEVLVSGTEVTISGERKIEEPQNAAWHRRERSRGRFSRMVSLPWEVDADKVEAKFHDGVLTIHLPKAEAARPKRIKVLPAESR